MEDPTLLYRKRSEVLTCAVSCSIVILVPPLVCLIPAALGLKRQLVLYLSEPSEHRAVNQSQWHSLEARQGNESMSVQYAQLLIDKFVATGDTVFHGS